MGLLKSDESMHSTWTISRREGHEAKYIYIYVFASEGMLTTTLVNNITSK